MTPCGEIPRKPVAWIWLPKIRIGKGKFDQLLRLHNSAESMDVWMVLKEEDSPKNNPAFRALINGEFLEALEKVDHTLI